MKAIYKFKNNYKNTFENENKFNKLFKNFLIVNGILNVVLIICGLALLITLIILPFPTRYNPEAFDEQMIKEGQLTSYYLLFSFGGIAAIIYNFLLINSGFLTYYCAVYKNKYDSTKNYIYIFVISLFSFLLPIFSFCYFFYFYKKKKFNNKNKRKLKISLIAYLCIIPTLSVPITFVSVILTDWKVVVDEKAVKDNLTYSNNKNNIVVLYFDRSFGAIWNMLLYIDEKLNKENSFINKFPEFTSYLNVISNASTTNVSNLTLLGGILYSPYFLSKNLINPISLKNYNSYTQNTYLLELIKNLVKVSDNYDFKNFNLMDYPYYDKKFNAISGEYWKLNNELKEINKNAYATSSSAILKSNSIRITKNNADSANYLKEITSINTSGKLNLIKFKNTENNVLKFLYFQNTHGPYTFYENNNFYRTNDLNENFLRSMWFVIQSLKNFLTIFKNEKDINGTSLYDKTMFVVVSDHGTNFSLKNKEMFDSFWNKYINSNEKEKNLMWNFIINRGFMNPVFMIKPFKENVDNKLTNIKTNNSNQFFNKTDLISLSDFPLILESEMYKIKNKKIPTTSFYLPKYNEENYSESELKYFLKNIIIDPLNNTELNRNRNFQVFSSKHWQWMYKEKTFNLVWHLTIDFPKNFNSLFTVNPIE